MKVKLLTVKFKMMNMILWPKKWQNKKMILLRKKLQRMVVILGKKFIRVRDSKLLGLHLREEAQELVFLRLWEVDQME